MGEGLGVSALGLDDGNQQGDAEGVGVESGVVQHPSSFDKTSFHQDPSAFDEVDDVTARV